MRNKLLALSCGALLLVACSASENSDSTSTVAANDSTPSGLDADGRVLFAQTVNAFVLDTVVAYGEDGLDPENIAVAVNEVYPSLDLSGSGVEADGGNISIMSNYLDDKEPAGPDNPLFVAVATKQVSGECFGAAVYGFPLPTERFEVGYPPECSAEAVWAALIEALAAE